MPTQKAILITGDWVADWNLARPANLPEGYFDGSLQTQLHHRPGGAWYVAHLIKNAACRDLTANQASPLVVQTLREPKDSIPGLDNIGNPREDIAHAYSVWWKHRRLNSAKKDDEVWRIARFAGCRKAKSNLPNADLGVVPASLLAVDDLGLGFSEHANAVEHVITHAGKDASILLKHGVRADGSGILSKLLEKNLGDRLHVVTSANALRRRNAALTRALSWDKVLEDIEGEFQSGPSSRDLAHCATAVIHFGLAGAAVFRAGKLHRFFFLPDELEGVWEADRPGSNFGTGSVIAACMARHLIRPDEYPLFFAVTQALAAQRTAHEGGAGNGETLEIDLPFGARDKIANPKANPAAECIAPPAEPPPVVPGAKEASKPVSISCVEPFRAAWNPADLNVWPETDVAGLKHSRLLCNVTGPTFDSLHAKAVEVVIQGAQQALGSVPKAAYEKYLTADRDEIESINEIRRLILEYRTNPEDKRPLSIAVFGAPGSGKSFAIKQVAKALFGKDKEPLEFNLTQIKTPEELHRAFHQVRDASIRLEIPLVFWDEFDTGELRWLADFLAPMQDAEFFDGSHRHPFGKCIFVFAGGTRTEFDEFKKWPINQAGIPFKTWDPAFKNVKGPDFISRLRGFVNVKGPNPTSETGDPAYVLRRALVLRAEIERLYPQLIHPKTKRASIAANVLHALLSVDCYEHGARSLTALLTMSALTDARAFNVSALPADGLLNLHVSRDFREKLANPVWTQELLLALAKAGHKGYRTAAPQSGDDQEWDKLSRASQNDNLDPVPRRLLEMKQLGWEAVPLSAAKNRQRLNDTDRQTLIYAMLDREHRIWLSRRLVEGFAQGPADQKYRRLNTDIIPFSEVSEPNQKINRAIISETLDAFAASGFCLVKAGS